MSNILGGLGGVLLFYAMYLGDKHRAFYLLNLTGALLLSLHASMSGVWIFFTVNSVWAGYALRGLLTQHTRVQLDIPDDIVARAAERLRRQRRWRQ
jgi:hypothetical protein